MFAKVIVYFLITFILNQCMYVLHQFKVSSLLSQCQSKQNKLKILSSEQQSRLYCEVDQQVKS